MKLNIESIQKNKAEFTKQEIETPSFDIAKVWKNTKENPQWLHFGAGNIFRAFIARINHTLLEKNIAQTGIIAVDTFDAEVIERIYKPFDNLSLLVSLKADGSIKKQVVAGVSLAYEGFSTSKDFEKIVEVFERDSLQIVSFTITEKAYSIRSTEGKLLHLLQEDIENNLENPKHIISILVLLLYKRFLKSQSPITLCSMDNCSHNGEKLRNAVLEVASIWVHNNMISTDFLSYISNEQKVSFPWSMIDKITPRPAEDIKKLLESSQIEQMSPIVTQKNTFIAPYVNAEVSEYLVIEDNFVNGRPALEEAGVYLTDRETVNLVEKMKVTTCLNPLHTTLAVFGCILGYTRISDAMENQYLYRLVEKVGYEEGMKVVCNPIIIEPKQFIDEVIKERLPNPFIPDTPQRIATDTSQKVGVRFGETIKSYMLAPHLDVDTLTYIPLAIAGWFRYLLAIDDNGLKFPLSSDPMMDAFIGRIQCIEIGGTYNGELRDILRNIQIFGVDLVDIGLATKIEDMFCELIQEKGAVQNVLRKYLQ